MSMRGSKRASGRPQKVHCRSDMLYEDENQKLFELIGPNCVTQATAVVRVFRCLPSSPNRWTKIGVGVATFIKDSKLRSFFIRVYNLRTSTKIFDEEIYNEFDDYKAASRYFHHFSGAVGVCGLSFADASEADFFKAIIIDRLEARAQKRSARKQKQMKDRNEIRSPSPFTSSQTWTPNISNPNFQQSNYTNSMNTNNSNGEISGMHVVEVGGRMDSSSRSMSMSSNSVNKGSSSMLFPTKLLPSSKKNKSLSQKKKEISKTDIGTPTNFRHLEHVGGGQKRSTSYTMGNSNSNNLELLGRMLVSHNICTEQELQSQKFQSAINQFISSKASIDDIIKAFSANQMASSPTNQNTSPPTSSSVDSIHRRHSVHSPTSPKPNANNNTVNQIQSNRQNTNSRSSFSIQNGSISVSKPPAPIRRPPPEPNRRDTTTAVSVSPHNRTGTQNNGFQRSSNPPTSINDVPARPPLPAGRPAGSPVFPANAFKHDQTTNVAAYDGNFPYTPYASERGAETHIRAPPPPLSAPQGNSMMPSRAPPPKTSPRHSSVDRFGTNEQKTPPKQNNTTTIPSSLSRPGSRTAISAPFEEPSASLVKTSSSYISTNNSTSDNNSTSEKNDPRRKISGSSAESSPTINGGQSPVTLENSGFNNSTAQNLNRFNMISRDQLQKNQQTPKSVPPNKASMAESHATSKVAPAAPALANSKPVAPPKTSKLRASPSSAKGEKASAPKPPTDVASKSVPAPPPPPPNVPAPPPPPPIGVPPPPPAPAAPSAGPSRRESSVAPKMVPLTKAKPDDLLDAIRKASVNQLKPAEERTLEPVKTTSEDPKSSLLGEIKNFRKETVLKKVEPNSHPKESSGEQGFNQLPGLLGDLARMVNEQRKTMNPDSASNSKSGNDSDECSDADSFDDDDWD